VRLLTRVAAPVAATISGNMAFDALVPDCPRPWPWSWELSAIRWGPPSHRLTKPPPDMTC